jgi:alpha-beta hydrolase superfamily lysophospholipase
MKAVAETSEGRYPGALGEIHYRSWSSPDPRWVVVLAHGFGDHSGSWARYAERLAAAGGAVVAVDHRGHGLSDGPRAVIDNFDVAAREYLGVLDVAPVAATAPVVLAGHSMGGLIATRAATLGLASPRGLVLSSTVLGLWPAATAVLETVAQGAPIPEAARGHVLLDPEADFDPSILSRDRTFTEAFVGDELRYVGVFPDETLRAWLTLQQRWPELPEGVLNRPTLYLHGGADPILSHRASVATLAHLVRDDLEVRIFPETRHSIYNELNRDQVFGVLTGFLSRATG